MGFTLRFLLGFVLALICSSLADENATKVEEIGEIKANTTLLTGNNLPKTDSSEDLTKLQKSEPYKKETTLSRSIDIDKYTSEDFHNRNNVYNIPVSPENEKFINSDFGFQVTTHRIPEHSKEFFDSHVDDELTTPKSAIFDRKFKEAVESVDQELEHIDEESHEFPESKDNLTLSEMYEATNRNDTKAELNYLNYKNIVANKTDEKNALHKGVEVEAGTNLDFQSSFSNTQIVDEKDDGNDTVEVETSTAKVEASTAKVETSTAKVETSTVKVETSTVKSFILTTKKSLILTKPPNTRNESHISILSNKIETDTVKPTDKPKIVTEASFNKTEQQVEENKVVPIHVEAPITATEPTSTILPETTTKLIETTTFSEELLTETATTEAATTEWFESTPETIVGNWTTTTQELPTTTTTPETSTTAIETTTLKTEQLTTIINEVTENQTTVEPLKATTTEDSIMPEDSAEDIDEEDNRTTPDIIDVVPYTTFTPDFKIFQRIATETETPTENATTPDVDELSRPPEDNTGTIAAITISSIGAVCLVLLAGLLYIMKKRQKRFNYGQRCTPVGLDDYSMDNVSVYNSVRRKGAMRSSKRSYGNPAFEDPTSVSHPLNFPALSKFSTNFEDMNAEFEEVPQIHARTNELPEGCDTKNRYANVIPLPETRVFLTVIESCPNSDYINANYVTGPKNIKSYYIACQAPMQNTVDDFWRMIWEQQSKVVLMVTHLFENGVEKCFDYLPPSEVLDCHRLFGDFQVTLKKREVKDKYVISILQLKNMVSNSWREIIHFWYIGWPEKGVPSEANSLIAFLIEARSHIKSSSIDRKQVTNLSNGTTKNEVNPVVVHCSPGTGRTGVVIACDIAIREFEQTRLVDIPRIVYRIRRDRASSVQTKEQYAFIYKVVCLYAAKLTGGALDSL